MMNRSKASYIKKKKKGGLCMFYLEWIIVYTFFIPGANPNRSAGLSTLIKKGIGRGPSAGCPCAWMCAADPGEAERFCLHFGSVEVWHKRQRWACWIWARCPQICLCLPPSVCILCKASGLQALFEGKQVEDVDDSSKCTNCFSSMLILGPYCVISTSSGLI